MLAVTNESLFREMLRIRLVEEAIIEHYPSDKIQSPVHLAIGQEAVAAGLCAALSREDRLFSTYRSHGYYLAKGGNLNAMMAELFGRKGGCCQGKGGSMHLSAPEVNFIGTSAIVATSISNAVGAALASKYRNEARIVVVVFGDGATEEGVYHESLNYASLHQLPILFVCENNHYAIHSHQEHRQSYQISSHVQSYGIPYDTVVEGYDALRVYETAVKQAELIREGNGPQYLEVETCRYKEHVGPGEDFTGGFRSRAEVENWMKNDPLVQDVTLRQQFEVEIAREISGALEFANNSPFPTADDLLQDVI